MQSRIFAKDYGVTKMANKKQVQKFAVDFETTVLELGGRKTDEKRYTYDWVIETKFGDFILGASAPRGRNSKTYPNIWTIYGRFTDVKKAAGVASCQFGRFNEYSGKWNIHEYSPEAALAQLKLRLQYCGVGNVDEC